MSVTVCTTSDEVHVPLEPADNRIYAFDNADFYDVWNITDTGTAPFDTTTITDAELRVVKQDASGNLWTARHSGVGGGDGTLTFYNGSDITTDPSTVTVSVAKSFMTAGTYDAELIVTIASNDEVWWRTFMTIREGEGNLV